MEKERQNIDHVIWLNLFTVFQLWILIPVYLLVPEKWKRRIRKGCICFFAGLGILVLIRMILQFVRAVTR